MAGGECKGSTKAGEDKKQPLLERPCRALQAMKRLLSFFKRTEKAFEGLYERERGERDMNECMCVLVHVTIR